MERSPVRDNWSLAVTKSRLHLLPSSAKLSVQYMFKLFFDKKFQPEKVGQEEKNCKWAKILKNGFFRLGTRCPWSLTESKNEKKIKFFLSTLCCAEENSTALA
jgi:hypothetical protein